MAEECGLRFGALGRQLAIRIAGQPHAGASDPWERDKLTAHVTAQSGTFSGQFQATLWAFELRDLRDALAGLHRTQEPAEVVEFRSREHSVELSFSLDQLGAMLSAVRLRPGPWAPGAQSVLEYEIAMDQSDLPGIIAQLDEILRRFPPALS